VNTLLRITALVRAVRMNDTATASRLIAELEATLDAEDLVDALEAVFDGPEAPMGVPAASQQPVRCA
jgi:hypothetical protein